MTCLELKHARSQGLLNGRVLSTLLEERVQLSHCQYIPLECKRVSYVKQFSVRGFLLELAAVLDRLLELC